MTNTDDKQHHSILKRIAHRAMIERGLIPDFPAQVFDQLNGINSPAAGDDKSVRDLRKLIWCSIDNDDSLDLDQLTAATAIADGATNVLIAIADVDAPVSYTHLTLPTNREV